MWLARLVVVALTLAGCASAAGPDLRRSVTTYNEGLRWKRFAQAASFVAPEGRDAFLRRYLASEERLHVESIEVRSVEPVLGLDEPAYDVTVVASAYVLPSNVLERIVVVQRWKLRDGAWLLAYSDRELAP